MAALTSLLDRDRRRVSMRVDAKSFLDVSEALVDEGTHLIARLASEAARRTPTPGHHAALLLLLRHIIELADSIDVQLREGVIAPTKLQTRSILEALMQIHYLLGIRREFEPSPVQDGDIDSVPCDIKGRPLAGLELANTKARRGDAYIVAGVRRHLRMAESYTLPNYLHWLETRAGTDDPVTRITDSANQAELARDIARLKADLASPPNREANEAFEATKAGQNRRRRKIPYEPEWYSLWQGPMSVRELASATGFAAVYDLSYGPASEVMHAADVLAQFAERNPASGAAPLRHRYRSAEVLQRYFMYVVHAYKVAMDELRPSDVELFHKWMTDWLPAVRAL